MATQPETLKFGPQWIRKLSDCAFPSQRTSNKGPVNKTSDMVANVPDDACGTKCIYSHSDRSVHDSNEEFDQFDSNVWDPVFASTFDPGDKKDRMSHRPARTKEDGSKLVHSRGLQFCPSNHNHNNNGYSGSCSDSSRIAQVKPSSFTTMAWPKPSNFSSSDRNWRRRPASSSGQHPVGFSSNGNGGSVTATKWKSSTGTTSHHSSADNENSVLDASGDSPCDRPQLLPGLSQTRPDSSELGSSSTTTAMEETTRESTGIGGQPDNQNSTPLDCPTTATDLQQHHSPLDSSFVPPLSKGFGSTQNKRAVSAYYGIQSSQKRFSETEPVTNALWEQHSHLWSKSVPHQLHGLEPGASDAIPASLAAGLLGHSMGLNATESSSVPETDRLEGYMMDPLTSLNPSSSLADPTVSYHPVASSHTTTVPDCYSAQDEGRSFHRPDGADRPDEHLWLYEDPQGRTQGTFSDAQMHEWLSAGIYFTPTLRIRRKCDDTFSTLADYTRLFGRVPFVPSFRVPPIRGGITPALLSLAAAKSAHLGSTEVSASSDSLHSTRGAAPGPSAIGTGLPLCTALHASTPSTTLSMSGSLESATSCVGRSPIAQAPHRSTYAHRPDPSEFPGSIGNHLVPASSMEDGRTAAHLKTNGGICANSSLPVLHNRQPVAPMSLLSHSLTTGLDLGAGPNANEATDVTMNTSSAGHTQPVAPDSTLMTLASLISLNPALASLALPFAGQAAAAAVSPGFLTALAQHLNVQPHTSGHQSVSPMQQLAEIAQLAAQLAAMVGAHSPDQTPMQPAQALALAQLVMSQATPPPDQSWSSLSKRDAPNDHTQDLGGVETLNRRGDKAVTDESVRRSLMPQDNVGSGDAGDDSRQESQSAWVASFGANSGNRISPRAAEGRTLSRGTPDNTTTSTCGETDRHRDGSLRTGGSTAAATSSTATRVQAKGQSKSNAQRSTTSANNASKTTNGFASGLIREADGVQSGATTATSASGNSSTTTGANWRWTASGSDTAESKSKKNEASTSSDRDISQKPSPSAKQPSNQWVTKVKQTPVKSGAPAASARTVPTAPITPDNASTMRTNTSSSSSSHATSKGTNRAVTNQSKATSLTSSANGSTRSPMKTTGTNPTSDGKASHVVATVNNTAPLVNVDSYHAQSAVTSSAVPDHTAEHELEQLTQWCQARLSSIPMREKVDIPTVVELLATLDAPYEVERMVQTFLGESARTSQFVKDFLDRRRPFWQLHRERRDRESQVKSNGQKSSQAGGHTTQSNVTRSSEKKKRTNTQESGNGRANTGSTVAGCNGGVSWHKGGSSQGNQTDPTQDNEWHHIKPKGGHNRKGKKDKAS